MNQHSPRRLIITSMVIAVALCLGLWPQSTGAVRGSVTLANENSTWSKGRFFRTGLAASSIGGIQLIPVKVQQSWLSTARLPIPLSSHSSAVYGDRIFVIGGNTYNGDTLVRSSGVFATRIVNRQFGQLETWTTLPNLPSALSDVASVVAEVEGQPFLFVMGGMKSIAGQFNDVTTSKIYWYPIRQGTDGNLLPGTWQELGSTQWLPHDTMFGENTGNLRGAGVRGLATTVINVAGTPYIYIFGGHNRVYSSGIWTDRYHSQVLRAPIGLVGGNPSLGTWTSPPGSTNILNSNNSPVPLAGAAAVTFGNPIDNSTGIYLIGGIRCTSTCDTSPVTEQESNVYVGRIAADGALSWLEQGNMSSTRSEHDAIQSQGQIIISGGRSNDLPTTSLAQGFVKDDLTLYRPTAESANFDLQQGSMGADGNARMSHTMETLSGGEYGDWAYIIGGKTSSTQDASDIVLLGNLNVPPTESDTFVSDGKYYSRVFDFGENAEYYNFDWMTIMGSGEQVQIQYRIGADPQGLGPLSAPVTSVNGANRLSFPNGFTARYFQFVVTLARSSSTPENSPVLSFAELDVKRVGFPNVKRKSGTGDIFPSSLDATTSIIPNVHITNEDFTKPSGEIIKALDANWQEDGTFFVDLYITGGTSAPRPTIGDVGAVYAEVPESALTVDAVYSVPNDRRLTPGTSNASNKWTWRPSSCVEAPCPLVNWNNIFSSPGTYTVYLMVDSDSYVSNFANVIEAELAGTDGESDNIYGPYTVQITGTKPRLLVPMVIKAPAAGVTVQEAPSKPQRVHSIP